MAAMDRVFGMLKGVNPLKSRPTPVMTEDQERAQHMSGRETAQSGDEQAATRLRMEAELDQQREKRQEDAKP